MARSRPREGAAPGGAPTIRVPLALAALLALAPTALAGYPPGEGPPLALPPIEVPCVVFPASGVAVFVCAPCAGVVVLSGVGVYACALPPAVCLAPPTSPPTCWP